MSAQIIDGKAIAASIKANLKKEIDAATQLGKRPPGLAVILVGDNPASQIYVRNKRAACDEIGVNSIYQPLPETVTQKELLALIESYNSNQEIDGILLQAPLPAHIDQEAIFESIDPKKDVDGFHPFNIGRFAQRRPLLRPCTPYGIMLMLSHIHQVFKEKHAVVVGASNIVGRPMALELLIAGSTVTICHRFTKDLKYFVKQADILIVAVGKQNLIPGAWIKEGATVIDVGQNRMPDGKFTGDVEFEIAKRHAAWITPVPGGVGPMTVAMLLHNTLVAAGYHLHASLF